MASFLDEIIRREAETDRTLLVCRAAATGPVDIADAPADVDGVTLAAGDVIFLPHQADTAESGPWQFAAEGAALTRPDSFNADADASFGRRCYVVDGMIGRGSEHILTSGTIAGAKTWISYPEVAIADVISAGGNKTIVIPVPDHTQAEIKIDVSVNGTLNGPAFYQRRGLFYTESGTNEVSGFGDTITTGTIDVSVSTLSAGVQIYIEGAGSEPLSYTCRVTVQRDLI